MKKVKSLLYCTKAKPLMEKSDDTCYEIGMSSRYIIGNDRLEIVKPLNGKIVCECDIETEKIKFRFKDDEFGGDYVYSLEKSEDVNFQLESCLDYDTLDSYLKGNNGYALHISNLKIFDKPLELKEVFTTAQKITQLNDLSFIDFSVNSVKKAHQNMMWVWHKGERYVLISIKPKWLCKILNGEKTIEVRRKVLNCMKGVID